MNRSPGDLGGEDVRRAVAVVVGLVVAALLSGWGVALAAPSGDGEASATRAVRALVAGDAEGAAGALPVDFADVAGYRPDIAGGLLLRPGGDCSSPLGATAYDFSAVCARHDLGYDLLRYAARAGDPLDGWARRAIDDQFAAGLTDRCRAVRGGLGCVAAAGLYTGVVRLNTWRQGDGAPLAESGVRSVGALLAGAGVGLLAAGVRRRAASARRPPAAVGCPAAANRHPRPLAPSGLLGAGAAAAPALLVEPLLPLTPAVHGVVVGIAAVHGYAVGVAVAAGWRWATAATAHTARRPHTPPVMCDGTRRYVLWAAAGAGLAVVAVVRATVGAVVLAAVAVAVLVLAVRVARVARVAVGLLIRPSARPLHQWGRGRVAVALGLVAAMSVVVPGATAAAAGTGTAAAVERGPAEPLGSEGRVFLTGGQDAAAIAAATEAPACTPVRAYVGLGAAAAPAERARRAVAELERAGGFARSTVLVVVPTGSGWVNPAAVTAAEHLAGGDIATVAVQYAARPSWQEYLLGAGAAQDSAVALVAALRERLDRIAPAQRPRLLLYGESLGALGARAAAPAADAVLVAGVPAAGWERDGDSRVRAVANVDDPVVWFSPRLLVARPTGWPGTWMPVVSFWQTAGSLLSALAAPSGHGHRYGAELADAWRATGVGAATCIDPSVARWLSEGSSGIAT